MAYDETTSDMVEGEGTQFAFQLIMASGVVRSYAFEALEAARRHDFDRADDLMEEARRAAADANRQQRALFEHEASGDYAAVDILLMHALDHLSTSLLAQDLIAEIICLYNTKVDVSQGAQG